MATVVVRKPDGTEEQVDVSAEVVVGRSEGSGLQLTEGGVSRKHARLFPGDGGAVMVEDLGSANGTFVNGERIAGPTALTPGAELVIGAYTLVAKAPPRRASGPRPSVGTAAAKRPGSGARPAAGDGPRSTQMVPRASGPRPAGSSRPRPAARPTGAAGGAPTLRGTGAFDGQTFTLTGKQVVGRVPGVDIQLEDDSVSRRHAELEASADGVVLRDLGSANGTQVNGEPVQGEVLLNPGDQVAFGVVELVFDAGATAASSRAASRPARSAIVPTRRSGTARAEAAGEVPAAAAPGGGLFADARKKRLAILGGAGGGFILLLMILALAGGGGPPAPPPGPVVPTIEQIAADVEAALSECRTYSSTQLGTPDWGRAEAACNRALELEPIHPEANQLIRKIRVEKEVFDHIQKAQHALGRLREDEAVEHFAQIPKESVYYLQLKTRAMEVAEKVKKRAGDDCRRYVDNRNYDIALEPCERYAKLACQWMSMVDLYPAVGQEMCLTGRRCGRDTWKPKDKTYGDFLLVRQKKDANLPPWQCPQIDIFQPVSDTSDAEKPENVLLKTYKAKYDDKTIAEALKDYWRGQATEAVVALQKQRANADKAKYHRQYDELIRDLSSAEQLFKLVSTLLQQEQPDRAAEPLREALTLDEKSLGKDVTEKYSSFFRSDAIRNMAKVSYAVGKGRADRGNREQACELWKLGWEFYKGDPDLARGVSACSGWAENALQSVGGCGDYATVLRYAVDGDGFKERVAEAKAQNQCQ